MQKGEGTKTVIFISIILFVGIVVTGIFVRSNIMITIGASLLFAVVFIASVVWIVKLRKKSRAPSDDRQPDIREDIKNTEERKERRKPAREMLKNTILLGGFLTSCVLFVIFCSIAKFMLGFIVWCCGVGLTVFVFLILLIRERIADSDLSERAQIRRAEKQAQKARDKEREEYAERIERPQRTEPDLPERAPRTEPDEKNEDMRAALSMSGKYKLVQATVAYCEQKERLNDYVDCGGLTFARTYGSYEVGLRTGGEIKKATSAVEYRRGSAVYALVGEHGAVIVYGGEIKFSDGKYKQKTGRVKLCIVDVASMVEKRRRFGDESGGDNWAVDPDHRFIVTCDVDGKRVRAESEIYINEGTEVSLLVGRGGSAVRIIRTIED